MEAMMGHFTSVLVPCSCFGSDLFLSPQKRLTVWSDVQVISVRSRWCHCHLIVSCFLKIQIGL